MSVIRYGNPFDKSKNRLESIIMNGLAKEQSVKRNRVRIHASSGGFCARRNVLHIIMEKSVTLDAAAQLYMGIGTTIHRMFQDALYKQGALLFSEYHLPEIDDLNLGGYIDAIVQLDGKIWGVEIKSCGKMPNDISEDHRLQALIYGAVTGLPMIVLYQSRNVAGWDRQPLIKAFRLDASEDDYAEVLQVLAFSILAHKANALPPVPAKFTSVKSCGHCAFKSICWPTLTMQTQTIEQPSMVEMSSTQYLELSAKAMEYAKELVANRGKRRNGVLKHLQSFGTDAAKQLLNSFSWNTLFDN